MIIRWLGDITGLDLKPTWDVQSARIHTVTKMEQPDGSKKDTIVLYFSLTSDQFRKLIDEYGKESIPHNFLGVNVIPLYPNAVLWTWRAPKDYPFIKDGTYTALEIVPNAEEAS